MSTPSSHEPAATAPAEAKSSGGLVRALIVAACISAMLLAQCAVAYFLLPSASDLSAAEEQKLAQLAKAAAAQQGDKHAEEEFESTDEKPQTEVDLGAFRISTHHRGATSTLRIDFRLVGMVETAQKPAFESLYEKHRNRIRDRIIFEIRSAEISDLSDPGLGLIKRRILERVNTQLGQPLVQGVVVSDFMFVGV